MIRAGVQRYAEQEGVEIELPNQQEAEAVVGMKDAGVWAPFLPDSHKDRWLDLRAVVLPMEVEEVSRGVDYLFDGVRPMLVHLELGVKVARATAAASTWRRCRTARAAGAHGLAVLLGQPQRGDQDRHAARGPARSRRHARGDGR